MKTAESLEVLTWSRRGAVIGGGLMFLLVGLLEYLFIWAPGNTPDNGALPQYMTDHPFVCLIAAVLFGIITGDTIGGNIKESQLRWKARREREASGR